jgi:hypothetical protein
MPIQMWCAPPTRMSYGAYEWENLFSGNLTILVNSSPSMCTPVPPLEFVISIFT